jgi:glycosyltransferase involved in cell wall biosynthesis
VAFPLYRDYRVSLPWGHGLARLLDQDPPDLIHVVSPTPLAVWAQGYGAKRGIPVVASFHTDFVSYFRYYGVRPLEGFGWNMLRRFYNRCRATYAPSHSTVRQLQRRGIQGVHLWSRGIDLQRFHPSQRDPALRSAAGAEGDMPLLLFAGRLVREKDLADLVHIHRQIKCPHRLVLVGDGPMRAELEAALPDAHFAGHQTGEVLARWFASGDVFVFPSTTETFGNVVLEAFASGLPAVVANRGGPPDLVDIGVTGLIAYPNDPADFARCVDELLADPERRRAMGQAARAAAERERDWDVINGRLLESYARVIAAG